jgi:hypothetical protein
MQYLICTIFSYQSIYFCTKWLINILKNTAQNHKITKLVADSYPVRRGTATKIALDQKLCAEKPLKSNLHRIPMFSTSPKKGGKKGGMSCRTAMAPFGASDFWSVWAGLEVFFLGLMKTPENTSKQFWAVRWASFGLFRPDETRQNPSGWGGSKTHPTLTFLSGWRRGRKPSVLGGWCFHPKHPLKHLPKHTKPLAPNGAYQI